MRKFILATEVGGFLFAGFVNSDADQPRLKIGYLSAMDIFQDLTPEEIKEIDRSIFMQTCKAGRVFYTPGQTGEVLFIDGVNNGEVRFHIKRTITKRELKGVKVENARWMGELLGRLSEKQLTDAFRAGNFDEEETSIYLRALRARIKQLQDLK